ncbi:DUF1090 domain-containing protein [Klebsiella sp. BIGb0407]|uniref:DUF1090 domain-containing protein n=1 Tax=Klebsiella sp. BIGb0407 TaxID=2940603 RepID=UPI002167B2ED|nr:DUF1090 domain-containing protein [Klebsiella sp. BIGb0407]MCS3429482.1 hypothetical protein [Klebsiella sp. BIGb0407]
MKYALTLLTGLLVVTPTFSALAMPQTSAGCEAKRQNIERQLDYARLHNNSYRAAGLERALSKVNTYCSDEELRAKRKYDIVKKEQEVEERRHELAEAQAIGRTDKIIHKQWKLENAQAELDKARSTLN